MSSARWYVGLLRSNAIFIAAMLVSCRPTATGSVEPTSDTSASSSISQVKVDNDSNLEKYRNTLVEYYTRRLFASLDAQLLPRFDFAKLIRAEEASFWLGNTYSETTIWLVGATIHKPNLICDNLSETSSGSENDTVFIGLYDPRNGDEVFTGYTSRKRAKVIEDLSYTAPAGVSTFDRKDLGTGIDAPSTTSEIPDVSMSKTLPVVKNVETLSTSLKQTIHAYPVVTGNSWAYAWLAETQQSRLTKWSSGVITQTVSEMFMIGQDLVLAKIEEDYSSRRDAAPDYLSSDNTAAAPLAIPPQALAAQSPVWIALTNKTISHISEEDVRGGLVSKIVNLDALEIDKMKLSDSMRVHSLTKEATPISQVGNIGEWRVVRSDDISTRAGQFSGCALLEWRFSSGNGMAYRWLCQGVGIVREEECAGSSEGRSILRELISYKVQ